MKMLSRRRFLLAGLALAAHSCSQKQCGLTGTERIDRVLLGQDVDRPPYTFYYHFGLQNLPGRHHAEATLEFHRKFRTDLVKVMSDFPFPKPQGKWHELELVDNPYPEQIRALEIIRDGLQGDSHFIETVFNPWNVAEELCSQEEVLRLKEESPQLLLDALELIAKSEASHARKAVQIGAAGVFLAVANAQEGILSEQEYEQFSEPFDKMVLESVSSAPLNTLHLHGDGVYLNRFFSGWPASVIQYSIHGTGVPFSEVRPVYDGVLMGGIDERSFRSLSRDEMESQLTIAQKAAGRKFILAPGCSVPDDTSDSELVRLVELMHDFGA
jgi:uroporphyrinogen decarboxylase